MTFGDETMPLTPAQEYVRRALVRAEAKKREPEMSDADVEAFVETSGVMLAHLAQPAIDAVHEADNLG